MCTLVVAAIVARSTGVGPMWEVVPLTLLLALSWAFPVLVLRTVETEAFRLDEPFFVAMALLLPAPGDDLRLRRRDAPRQRCPAPPPVRAAFNIGQTVTAAGLGLAVMQVITPYRRATRRLAASSPQWPPPPCS